MSGHLLTVTVSTPGNERPLTANAHKRTAGVRAAKVVRRWRDAACAAWRAQADACGVESLPAGLTVTAQAVYADRCYSPDVGAQAPTLKACIDGLRAPTPAEAARGIDGAGLIPDDSPEWISRLVWLPAAAGERHGLRVTITGPDSPDVAEQPPGVRFDPEVPAEYHAPEVPAEQTPAEQWAELRDTACHAVCQAWQWALSYQRDVSMRNLAAITGIKRPTLIRWCNWSDDDKSVAHDPYAQILKMLHPERYAALGDDDDHGPNVQRHTPRIRNGGPWPIDGSDPQAWLQVRDGCWQWLDAAGATGGIMTRYDPASGRVMRGDGHRLRTQADALDDYWQRQVAGRIQDPDTGEWLDDPNADGAGGDDEPF